MDSIIHNIEQIAAAATSVAETKFELLKLKATGKVASSVSGIIALLIVILMSSIALIVISFGLSYFIGNKLNDVSYGFFIVGGFYALAGFIIYMNREKWVQRPLTNVFIDKFLK